MTTYYWVARTESAASTANNWSLTSGGIPQGSVPEGTDVAIFDGGYDNAFTWEAGADNFTLANHGLTANTKVYMKASDPTVESVILEGFSTNTVYYVVNEDANTFQLSASSGGAPITWANLIDTPTVNIFTKPQNCTWDIASLGKIQTEETYTKVITVTQATLTLGSLEHKGGMLSTNWTSSTWYNVNFTNTTPALSDNRKHIKLGPKGKLHPKQKKYWTWTLTGASSSSAPLLFDSGEYPHLILTTSGTGYVSPQYSTMTNTNSNEVKMRSLKSSSGVRFAPYGNQSDDDFKMKFTFIEHHNATLGYQFTYQDSTGFDGGVACWTFQASQSPSFYFPLNGYHFASSNWVYGKTDTTNGDTATTSFHKVVISSDSYGAGGVCLMVAPYSLTVNELVVESGAMLLGGTQSGPNSTIRCRKTPVIRGSWNFSRINDGVYSTGQDKGARFGKTTDVASGGTGLSSLPYGQIMYGKGSSMLHSANFKYDFANNVLLPGAGLRITESASTPLTVADGEGGVLYVKNTNPTTLVFRDDDGTETTLGAGGGGGGSDTTYGISCVDGDNSDEEKIRLTASTGGTDDVVLEAGTGLSIARSSDKITFTNTVTDSNLTTEEVQDIVGGMLTGNTETNITVTYQDGDGTIDFVATDTQPLTTEQVQDIVGAMFTGNTETRGSLTYQDGDGTIDLVVDDMTADTNTQTTYVPSVVDSSDDALIRLTAGGAGSGTQDIKLVAGSNITLTPNTGTTPQQITIAAAGGGGGEANENSFKTISVAGQDDVVADTTTDTLTLAAGSNMAIATTAGSDTITFTSTDTNTQTTYTPSWVDSGSNAILRLAAGGAGSGNQDLTLVAGSNITLTPSGSNLTIAAAGGGGGGGGFDIGYELVANGGAVTPSDKQHLVVECVSDGLAPITVGNMQNDCIVSIINASDGAELTCIFLEAQVTTGGMPTAGGGAAGFNMQPHVCVDLAYIHDTGSGSPAYFLHSSTNLASREAGFELM
tara:strand:- start:38183 stop:41161 length:2979 start_codon:yes stop_codon:yes gene_type:complete